MKKISVLLICTAFILGWFACKKTAELPPVNSLFSWTKYSFGQLRSIASCTNSCKKRFTDDAYITGVVIADEISGNFYKEVYLRDTYVKDNSGGGIHLDFIAGHCNFFIGDSIRLNLKGLDVNYNESTSMLEIDSIDFEKYAVKYGSGPAPKPIQLRLSDINSNNPYSNYLCDLVTINDVGFIPIDTNQIYADPILQVSINRTLADCNGNQLIVRTSNYASFAQERTPKGYGSITGIATSYKGANQLAIRNTGEVQLKGSGCTIYAKKDFNDNSLTSGGWSQVSVTNSLVSWAASSFSGAYFAKVSGYVSGNKDSEAWMISPSINLSGAINPAISFITAAKFSGNALELWVSTNYNTGAPSSATWIELKGFNLSPNTTSYVWTPSGDVSLSAFKSANVRVAFKYKSTTAGATTYEVDDIIIKEK